jgi:autotransporter-associated beta strand protein
MNALVRIHRLLYFVAPSALAVITASALSSARAADGTWLGNSGTWSNTAIWAGGIVADGIDSKASFTGVNIGANRFITNDAPRTLGVINFTDATTASHNLFILGSTITLNVTTGTPQINVTNQLLTLSNQTAGTKGFIKNGAGTLVMAANNSGLSGGGVTVNSGSLRLTTSANALGGAGGPTILLGSTVASSTAAVSVEAGNSINVVNAFVIQAGPTNPGTRTISSSATTITPTFSGNITVNENLRILQDNPGGNLTISGTSNAIAPATTVSFLSNDGGSLTDSAIWQGAGTVTYSTGTGAPGGGTMSIGGQKTHAGGSQILSLAGNTNTPSTAAVTANSTGPAGSPTSGPFGVGTLTLAAGSRLRATTSADITIANPVTLGGNMTFPTIASEKSLTFTGPATLTTNRTVTVDVGATVAGKFVQFAGAIGQSGGSHSFTKAGTGVLLLGGDNTFTGNATVSAGTLQLGIGGTLTNSPVITLASNTVFDVTAKAGAFEVLTNQTLACNGGTVAGAMSVSGTLNLTSDGKVDATTVNAGGRVNLSGPAAATNLVFAGSGTMSFNLAAGGTLAVSGTDGVTNNGAPGSITINLADLVAPPGGAYTLIAYHGGIQGGGGFAAYQLGVTPPGASYSLLNSPGAVQLVVTPALTWTGIESGEWSTNLLAGLMNWQTGGTPTNYQNGLDVVFSDSLTGTNVVDISVADVSPGTVLVNHSLTNYVLRGSKGIVGGSSFYKFGTNALTIENDNAYTGPTVIGAGQLILGNGGTSGSISNTIAITNNGALIVNRSDTLAVSSPIVGTGTLTKQGAGTLILSGTNNYNGATLVSAGALKLGAANIIPNGAGKTGVTVNGTFDVNGFSETINGLAGSGVVDNTGAAAATLTIGGNNASSTFNGILSNSVGTLNLAKVGTGTITLSNANSFTGRVDVTAGTLALGNHNTLDSVSSIAIASGARLQINPSNTALNVPITLGTNGSTATITAPSAAAAGGAIVPLTINSVISGDGNLLFSGVNSGNTYGTIILNAQNTYGGFTLIDTDATGANCFVRLGANNALPPTTVLILDGGPGSGSGRDVELNLNGFNQTLAGLTNILNTPARQQAVINSSTASSTLTVNNGADFTYTGQLGSSAPNGNFTLVKNGAGTFTIRPATTQTNGITILDNFYTGGTVISAGTLLVNNTTGSGTGSGSVTVNGGTLGGTGSIAGPVTVNTGGTFSPGTSIGIITISNTLTLAGTTFIEISKTGGTRDRVVGVSNLNYGGTLVVSNLAGTLAAGDSFAVFSAASSSGSFATITPAPGPGLAWNLNPATGVLSVVNAADVQWLSFTSDGAGGILASGSGGAPLATYVVVTETNMTIPVVSWIPVYTNAFDAGGNFSIAISNVLQAPELRRFFRMVTP